MTVKSPKENGKNIENIGRKKSGSGIDDALVVIAKMFPDAARGAATRQRVA